jgi:hypothetical protein
MNHRLDPEEVDLASVRHVLQTRCGLFVEGELVGRTQLRDEVARHLACSELEAELFGALIGVHAVRADRALTETGRSNAGATRGTKNGPA